jgi:hypothetical protein
MTKHVLSAWKIDIENRVNGIDRLSRDGCRVVVHEIKPGVIYTDRNIRVTAFPVRHGLRHSAFGSKRPTRSLSCRVTRRQRPASPNIALAAMC